MTRIASAILVWITAALFAAAAFATDAVEIKSKSGITAWLVEDKTIPLIAINYAFARGSTSDPAGKEGVAHFLTGMMDEGAANLTGPEFQAKRDRLAVRMSFETTNDNFYGTLQTLSKNRAEAFELLKLALTKPRFEAEPFNRMQQYFVEAARNKEKDPETIAFKEWIRLALGSHPYSRINEGTTASIAAITAQDLFDAHKRIYTRDDLKVTVVGDITPEELTLALDNIFGELPAEAPTVTVPMAEVAKGPQTKIIDFDIPQSIIVFGSKGILDDDPAYFPALVMAHILGGDSSNSWLFQDVREKRGLTYGVGYSLWALPNAALYTGSMSTVNAKAGDALQAVKSQIERMATTGPTQQELDDAKSYLTGTYALRFDTSSKIAAYLMALRMKKLPIDFAKSRNKLVEAVTLEQVREQAKRLLSAKELIVVAIGKPEGLR
jgi:zinc protease